MDYPTELVAKAEYETEIFERVASDTGAELLAEVKRLRAQIGLNWYLWNTDIGNFLACAQTVEKARTKIMGTLSKTDAAREELAGALLTQPKIVGNKPQAFVTWHQ